MGSDYCVPTAAMNALAYAAQHGFPDVQTGVHHHTWWASAEGYGAADGLLGLMGFLMGTDPSNGMNGAGGLSGLTAFLDGDDFMVMMAVNPRDGRLWMTSRNHNRLYRMDVSGPAPVATPFILPTGVVAPNHLNLSDSGRIHLASGFTSATVKVLEVSGTTLQLVPGAPFANIAAGGPLFVPHSMTNRDPATMEGPEFRNELPTDVDEGVGDCLADIGTLILPPDGQVDVSDLLAVLAGWGACPQSPLVPPRP
ncbi:MAG: hypothetical protein ACYTG1_02365 [Planctomycetota bacterium]|jgi:hypothetical protein